MRKRDIRGALLMDHNHGRLFTYRAGSKPRITFLPKNMPEDLSRQYDDDVAYKIRANREESIRDFFREASEHLQDCTEIVLIGPGTAKGQFAGWLTEKGHFSDIPIRQYTASWMDEPAFESLAREKLNVPEETELIFLKQPRNNVRYRLGSPGAPVDPENYRRTNEIKNYARTMGKAPGD